MDSEGRAIGCTIWFTGLPSSGKSTLAKALCSHLTASANCPCYNVDGDTVRTGLCSQLTFSDSDRAENVRRCAEVARMMASAGLVCVVSLISPLSDGRSQARRLHSQEGIKFFEVYLSTPLVTCERRDAKGLYAKARRHELTNMTGIDGIYEPPETAEVVLDTTDMSVDMCTVYFYLKHILGIIQPESPLSYQLFTYEKKAACLDDKDLQPLHSGFVKNGFAANGSSGADTVELCTSVLSQGDCTPCNPSVQLNISVIDAQWVQTIMDGWSYPLEGFMREHDYLECLHFKTITRKGKQISQSVPIILSCTDQDKILIEGVSLVDLVYNGSAIATLRNPEVFAFRKEEHFARLFGTTDLKHPAIAEMNKQGAWLVGGELDNYKPLKWNDGLDNYRLTVGELKFRINQMSSGDDSCWNKRAVVAFQLRNPLHNGHILLIEKTVRQLAKEGYDQTIVVLHPLPHGGGWTKPDDVPLDVRMKQHQVYINVLGWSKMCLLAIFPSPMFYAGPVEVQWHASARARAGITHYIVGRDPAGLPHPSNKGADLYDPTHGAKVLSMTSRLNGLILMPFPVIAYSKSKRRMDFYEPTQAKDFEFISGTLMRTLARKRESPVEGFMHPDAWAVLVEYYS